MTCNSSCVTFSIVGEQEIVFLNMPQWGGETRQLNKEIDIFDFWSGNFDTTDRGISNEPITISGTETSCNIVCNGLTAPICSPICMNVDIDFFFKFRHISDMMINHEEVTISGLGTCLDAVYVISKFTIRSITAPNAFEWTMILEFVRES